MDTYDLNGGGGGAVPLTYSPNVPIDNGAGVNVPVGTKENRSIDYRDQMENKKGADNNNNKMMISSFSTPIEELGYDEPMEGPMYQPQSSVAPHEMLSMRNNEKREPEVQAPPPPPPPKTYPLGLTEQQFEALIIVALVMLVFYHDVQAKLGVYVPNFLNKDGTRSIVGLMVSGAIVVVGLFVARRYLI